MADDQQRIIDAIEKLSQNIKSSNQAPQRSSPTFDFSKASQSLGASITEFTKAITTNVDVWRKLSSVGANFSNDIVGMSTAAVEARVSLSEFADLISSNAKNFAGLGGSVSRGTEVFAKLTKEFQDNDYARQLMNLGLTTKEVNETLALNIGFQKSSMRMDKNGKDAAFAAATSLAKEMDLIAKLTGKTREEQERSLRKAQQDGEIEAKFRLIKLEQGADAEREARTKFAEQLAQAEKRGQGELFKDIFTKGVPASEEAATQYAVMGKSAQATAESAKYLAKGMTAAADAASKRADVETAMLQNDKTFLTLGTLGGKLAGAAGDVAKSSIEVNGALHQSIEAYKNSTGELVNTQKDYAKALDVITEDLKRSQLGIAAGAKLGEAGKHVAGATEGFIAVEKATKDAAAGIASSMNIADKSGKTIADSLRNIGTELNRAVIGFGNIRERIEAKVGEGIKTPGAGGLAGIAGAGLKAGVEVLEKTAKEPINAVGDLLGAKKERETGTLGATGNLVENFKKSGELVELHGTEGVLTDKQLVKLTSDAASATMDSVLSAIPDPNVANEKLIKKIFDGSMPGIKLGDFTAPSSSKPNLDTLKIPGISWGDMSKPAASTTTTTPAANAKTTTAATASASESKKDASPAMPKQTATLDDVVKSLDQLNKQMGQLIDQQHELLTKQERAIRSNSPNVFDKVR